MKLDYVIVSSDDNPKYLDFWNIIKNLWINKINLTPILIKIDTTTELIDEKDGSYIYKIKKIDNINTGFQSQISRLFAFSLFENKNMLISDIDMLPLNKNYYINTVKDVSEDKIVIYSSDAYTKNTINPEFNIQNRYPMCYVAGNSNVMGNILEIDNSFEDFVNKLYKMNLKWDTDEVYLSKKLDKHPEKLVKFNRGWTNNIANDRIDRVKWSYDINSLKTDTYIDCHSLRPYENYKNEINQLIKYANINR